VLNLGRDVMRSEKGVDDHKAAAASVQSSALVKREYTLTTMQMSGEKDRARMTAPPIAF
jgi:hypothetical protein